MRKARLMGAGALTLLAMLSITASAGAAKGTVLLDTPFEPVPGVVSHHAAAPGATIYQTMVVELGTKCLERVREEVVNNVAPSVALDAFPAGFGDKHPKGCQMGIMKMPGITLSAKGTLKLAGALEASLLGCVYKFSHVAEATFGEHMEAETTGAATLVPKLSWAEGCAPASMATIQLSEGEVEEELIENLVEVGVKQEKKP